MPELTSSQGWIYLQQSKLDRRSIFRSKPKISPAPLYKTYSGTPRYELPRPRNLQASLFKALSARRSRRDYGNAIAIQELADLLWACQGITARAGKLGLRTAPSAGALYPLETYLLVLEAEGLPKGTYHFNCEEFSLELLREGDFSKDMAEACLNQQFMGRAGVDICWSAIFRRSMNKYGHRGMRYILMDAGHACQNLLLAAEALRLAACPVGAFFDEEVNALFDLDGEEESAVYCTSIGARAD
jgi:SagB-type dehydrogenase family enzyme